ncbi:hypothetical protein ACLM45_02215 [Synechococcus sp. A10-1-5-9]|uniref:hypothetical protein n=1 Tax=Synechococcus sp. A10-1-5-9 TaxID=3392295 RepID=UPI0039E90851
MPRPVLEVKTGQRERSQQWVPLLLLILAFLDLRTELRLLLDHITLTALMFAFRQHTLAVIVLMLQPSLWSHYRRGRIKERSAD